MKVPAIWFPAIRTETGTDVFTERLVNGLNARGLRAEITWLPLRAEYIPWTVSAPRPPEWATVCHVNTWLHPRFIPRYMQLVATLHHSIHDPELRTYKGWLRAAYHRRWIAPIERRVLRRANRVVAVSQFASSIARQFLCDVPIDVIYNGVDTEMFRPDDEVRSEHKPFQLLYVGSWKRLKGVNLLEPIMRKLGDGFELHYTGGERGKDENSNMPSNMHNLGRLSNQQVASEMRHADALLAPSMTEGHPLVVIEALASGLPIVATRGSSLVESVRDGITGLLCRQGDVNEFVSAIRYLDRNRSVCKRMSLSARADACERFSDDGMVDSYAQVYRDQVSEIRSGPPLATSRA